MPEHSRPSLDRVREALREHDERAGARGEDAEAADAPPGAAPGPEHEDEDAGEAA